MKEKFNLIGSSKPAVLLRCHSYVGPYVTKTAFFFSICTKKLCILSPSTPERNTFQNQWQIPVPPFVYKKKYNHRKIQFSWINEFPDPVYLHAAPMLAPKPAVALTRTMRFWRHLVERWSTTPVRRLPAQLSRYSGAYKPHKLRLCADQSAAWARPITIKDFGTNLNRE